MSETGPGTANTASQPPRFRFPLTYAFYGMAELAAALAAFGTWGIVLGALVLLAWAFVFYALDRRRALLRLTLVLLLGGLVISCLLPANLSVRDGHSYRGQCANNLRCIALALKAYQEEHGALPPTVIYDDRGQPMHSWRVLILPYLEEQTIYNQYNFKEPWNGPNNSKLAANIPPCYRCPSHPGTPTQLRSVTSYFAVSGENSPWASEQLAGRSANQKDLGQGVLVIESHQRNVNWLEPSDISADEALQLITGHSDKDHGAHAFDSLRKGGAAQGRFAALADGSVTVLVDPLNEETAAALVYANGDPEIRSGYVEHIRRLSRGEPGPDFWFRLLLFVLVSLFPLPWVWIHRHGAAAPPKSGHA